MLSLFLALLPAATPLLQQDSADDRYHFIVGLYDKGMYELVVTEGEGFLKDHPNHQKSSLARYRLASAQFELDRKADALEHFRKLAKIQGFEFEAEANFRLGQCALEAQSLDEAAEAFARVGALGKGYLQAPASFLLAETRFQQEDFKAAELAYQKTLEADERQEFRRDSQYGLAWCAFRQGNHDEAIRRIDRFLAQNKGDALEGELRFLKGEAHFESSRYEEALKSYTSVTGGPFLAAANRGAAFACAELSRSQEAAAYFGKVIETDAEGRFTAEAALQQGIQLLKSGNPGGAVKALEHKSLQPIPEVFYWRAQAWSENGDKERALTYLDRALQAKPEPELAGRIQAVRGDLLFDLGRMDEAVSAYSGAESDYALHAAAVASFNRGDHENAADLARKLLKNHPKSDYRSHGLMVLGEALLALDDFSGAEDAFKQVPNVAEDQTQKARAFSRIAWCRYFLDDKADAASRFANVARDFSDTESAEESLFMAGRTYEELEQFDKAIGSYESYVKRYPKGEYRTDTLLRLSRFDGGTKSEDHLATLLQEFGGNEMAEQALFEMAERRAGEGDRDAARSRYRELLKRFPNGQYVAPARYGLAWVLYEDGDYPEAARHLAEMTQMKDIEDDLRVSGLELLVWCQEGAGNPDGAASAYENFARIANDDERVLRAARTVAQAFRTAGRTKDAEAILGTLEGQVKDPTVLVNSTVERCYLALEQEQTAQAAAHLQTAAGIAPTDPMVQEAAFFVGEAYYDAGDDQSAIAHYTMAVSTPESPVADRAYYKEGFTWMRAEEFAKAAAAFDKLVKGHEKSELWGEGLFLLGEAHYRAGNYEQAVAPLSTLRNKMPQHAVMSKTLFRLGLAEGRNQNWEQAESALTELARRFPDFPNLTEAELWRGRALAARNNRRAARQAFDRVLAKDKGPLAAQARLGIGRLHLNNGEFDEALSEFLKVAVLYAGENEVSEGLYMAGQCLESMNDLDRARSQYQELIEKYPDSSFAAAAGKRLRELGSSEASFSSSQR